MTDAATGGGPAAAGVSAIFVNSTRIGTDVPSVLYTFWLTFSCVPTAESAGKLPPSVTFWVATGAIVWPTGILSGPIAAFELTLPFTSACHPSTNPPFAVTRLPEPSSEKLPARV